MSYHSHRRPTPVPTDSIFVFGREIDQLPSISESPPDKPERAFTHSMESMNSSDDNIDEVPTRSPHPNRSPTSPLTRSPLATSWPISGEGPHPSTSNDNESRMSGSSSGVHITEIKEEAEDEEEDQPLVSVSSVSGSEPKTDFINLDKLNGLNESSGTTRAEKEKESRNSYVPDIFLGPEESVKEAALSLFFIVFHVAWSVGVGFWHKGDGKVSAGHLTLAIIILSGVLIELAYFFNGNIKKGKIWKSSKCLWLLFLIPWTLPIFMSFCNVAFAVKEAKDPKYVRPWTNSKMVFLMESLTLAFPQCVLQLCLLVEDYEVVVEDYRTTYLDHFPSVKGGVIAAGLFILSGGMTFARIRFDSAKKVARFGVGMEQYIRYSIIWASKVLWLLTYCCLLVSVRIMYGEDNYIAVGLSIAIVLFLYEVPILLSTIQACNRFTSACLSLFFLLPQFVALFALLLWVNVDASVYACNIGSCILGMFFWVESLCIMGWLLDRCTGRDADFISEYPHFFGNVFKRCFK